MKILLASPARPEGSGDFWDFRFTSFLRGSPVRATPTLALPTLAALCPPDAEVRIVDAYLDPVPIDEAWDLVGISANTCLAPDAYALADEFRARGTKVVLGGIHPSLLPEEASRHADSVVVGEAEDVFPRIVEDAAASRLQPLYRAPGFCDLSRSPAPRWELVNLKGYSNPMVQSSRGCPNGCDFCSVRLFLGTRYRWKSEEDVIREIAAVRALGKDTFFWADDNLVANRTRLLRLLPRLEPAKQGFFAQVTLDVADDPELLERLAGAGCKRVIIGFESLSAANLADMKKAASYRPERYAAQVRAIQKAGVEVMGSFILGLDGDDASVFANTAMFIREAGLSLPILNVLTPYPGTALHARLRAEGRILSEDWSLYDGSHAVFRPARMSPEELEEGYRWIRREVFSYDAIFRRLESLWKSWNETGARRWDRISPILVNLEAHAAAFGFSPPGDAPRPGP